jgi:hypothetical protein
MLKGGMANLHARTMSSAGMMFKMKKIRAIKKRLSERKHDREPRLLEKIVDGINQTKPIQAAAA